MGEFIGDVKTEWLKHGGDDRKMRLLEDFLYIDAQGKQWLAPKDHEIDGASIPEMLWTLEGPPFVGDYRRATVLHDVYCDTKSEPHKAVHRMFYDAMRSDGVGRIKATKMYAAVRLFGPSWGVDGKRFESVDEGPDIDAVEAAINVVLRE